MSSVGLPTGVQRTENDKIAQTGIHIVSTVPISLYGLNQLQATTDAYLALPTPWLGTEHFAISYGGSYAGSQFLIVGAHDDTQITITPSNKAGSREKDIPYQIILQQGETYRLVADGVNGDLTGSLVVSNKPVAFFSGHECTQVPAGRLACDFIIEQLPPVSSWGKQFITVPLASRKNGDTFRALAAENDTAIYINNSHIITLQRGQYYEFILKDPSLIESDKPLLLAQYSNSGGFDGVTADPFMMLVIPAGQYLSQYVVTTPAQGIRNNYINIVIPELAAGTLKLDGQPISATFRTLAGTRYQTVQLTVEPGQHTIEAAAPFGAYIYGFDVWDSYGYPAGTALRNLEIGFQPLSCLSGINARAKPNNVQLIWTDTGAEKYAVYRAESYLGTYTKVGETKSHYSTFLDKKNLQEKKNYFYRIDELDENDEIQCSSSPVAAYVPETITPGSKINRVPYFKSTPESNALLKTAYKYQINAVDPDNDALTYQLLEFPTGAGIDDKGELTWLPETVGRFTISVQVSDTSGAVAIQSFEVYVRDSNKPPVITSTPLLEADAGLPYTYQVTASDPDGDSLTYTLNTFPEGMTISASGLIAWTPTATQVGNHNITVAVSDGKGGAVDQQYVLTVSVATPTNNPPVITSTPVETGATGIEYTYQIVATDQDGDSLTYSVQQGPTDAAIDTNGLFTWALPTQGSHEIKLAVSDGTAEVTQVFTLTISDPIPVNNQPIITSTPADTGTAGQTYTYQVEANDPDGDPLTYTLDASPEGMTISHRVDADRNAGRQPQHYSVGIRRQRRRRRSTICADGFRCDASQ